MRQIHIPFFPISDLTVFTEIPEVTEECLGLVADQTGSSLPIIIFEPHTHWMSPNEMPEVSEAPEEILVVAFEPLIRAACFRALECVAKREPKYPNHSQMKSLKLKEDLELKSIFKQMADIPMTVFSLTFPDEDPEAISIFFLRTPFTVSEFRREMTKPIG